MESLKPVTIETLEPDERVFYPTHENSIRDLRYYWKNFYCFDYDKMKETDFEPKQIEVQGDYNSVKARHLKIMFEKCDSNLVDNCKTDEEITEWMKRKFVVVLENQTRFDNAEYE